MKVFNSLCLVISAAFLLSATPGHAKPLPPLQVRITPVQSGITSGQIKPGDLMEFKVTAVSFMDVPELRINVELLGGVKLISGDTSWNGPAAKNEEKGITLTVQVPEKGKGGIRARVSIPPSNGTRFSADAHFELGPKGKAKPEQEPAMKKDRKGRDIIEYR
jgi:hypothetical protein